MFTVLLLSFLLMFGYGQEIPTTTTSSTAYPAVRLADGGNDHGRVEIFYQGQWGTICDRSWDITDATVVCRQLGFKRAIATWDSAFYGPGNGTIWLDEVECRGYESYLSECQHSPWGQSDCIHYDDVSVDCYNVPNLVCTHNQFSCSSGECINRVFLCDQKQDCLDESDEAECNIKGTDSCEPIRFPCTDGSCIQSSFVCDFKEDCSDGSDEKDCVSPDCMTDEYQCGNGQCISIHQRCNFLEECTDGTDERLCLTFDEGFQCYSGTDLPERTFCDGFRDCPGQLFEDEPISCDYLQSNFSCDANSLQCKSGPCTTRDNICVLDHDKYGFIKGCRDLTHLDHCDMFVCSDLHYKCHNSYCIPQHYRCDNKRDCPQGEDECDCEFVNCNGGYKCQMSNSCLAQHLVCDAVRQCPSGDDEWFCHLECPYSCSCIGLVYSCLGPTWSMEIVAKIPRNVRQLSVTSLRVSRRIRRQVEASSSLTIYDATFLNIDTFPFLFSLDLSSNGITDLGNRTFLSNNNLQRLYLSFNEIVSIGTTTFDGLRNLRTLDLQGNPLTVVFGSPFKPLSKLTFLSIQNSEISVADANFVDGLSAIQTFRSDNFYYCCLLNGSSTLTECLPPQDEFSSCTDLIRSTIQRILIWIMAISALSGNVLVIALRLLKKPELSRRRVSAQPVLVMNLALADLLMGVYLLMIAIADVSHRGRYALFSDVWQKSFLCRLAGFLSTVSSLTSVLFLTVISIDRYTSVLYPLSPKRLTVKSARIVCVVLWILMMFLGALPAFIFSEDYYGRSSVCLALPITAARPSGWLYSFVLFVVLNLILLIVIAVCYSGIFMIARRSTKFPSSKTKPEDELQEEQLRIAVKVSLLVVSDFFCWMPIIIMGILALTSKAVTGNVYAWTAVLVLPINSAVNPYLYTFLIERSQNKSSHTNRPANDPLREESASNVTTKEMSVLGVIKAANTSMRLNRLLAPDNTDRYQNYRLSTLIAKGNLELSANEINDIITDVGRSLEYLHKSGATHGNVNEDYVIIDELYRGNKRAYLLMCVGPGDQSTTEEHDKHETTDEEMVAMETIKGGSTSFEQDVRNLKELRLRLQELITEESQC